MSASDSPTQFQSSSDYPKYSIGTECRWIPMPSTDWGTIIGQIFVPVEAEQFMTSQWQWCYLLLLAPDSPSHNWVIADWVNETDLELLPPQPKETPSYSGEEP